jgi:hypothetical protein
MAYCVILISGGDFFAMKRIIWALFAICLSAASYAGTPAIKNVILIVEGPRCCIPGYSGAWTPSFVNAVIVAPAGTLSGVYSGISSRMTAAGVTSVSTNGFNSMVYTSATAQGETGNRPKRAREPMPFDMMLLSEAADSTAPSGDGGAGLSTDQVLNHESADVRKFLEAQHDGFGMPPDPIFAQETRKIALRSQAEIDKAGADAVLRVKLTPEKSPETGMFRWKISASWTGADGKTDRRFFVSESFPHGTSPEECLRMLGQTVPSIVKSVSECCGW